MAGRNFDILFFLFNFRPESYSFIIMIAKESQPRYVVHKNIASVDKVSNISKKDLIKDYIEPGIPVVVTDMAKDWKAIGKITPEYIKQKYGHLTKEVKGVTYTFAEFIDLMLQSTPEKTAPYPFNVNIEKYFPEIRQDAKPEVVYGKIDRINHPLLPRFMMNGTDVYEIFMGGNGAGFPFLHIDELYLHNSLTQVYGAKEFILFGPDQTEFLYPQPNNPKVSQVDVRNPDYNKFPLFRQAKPLRVMVEQGETLLFSTGWWHTTRIYGPCISLGRCQLNGSNWNQFIDDEYRVWKNKSKVIAPFIWLYGKAVGQVMSLQEKFA